MSDPLILCGEAIQRGQRGIVTLPLPKLSTHTDMQMPVHVLHGKRKGPILLVCAGIHGDEINGVEVIRRLCNTLNVNKMWGTLIAVPIVNVYGFIHRTRYLPDRRDLNRSFPGSASGSMASQLAHLFMTEIVSKCNYGIDLHTAAIYRENLPQIRASLKNPQTLELAKAFQAPIILDTNRRSGSIRQAASAIGIPWLLYEAGEALRFDEISIRAGVQGVLNIMKSTGILSKGRAKQPMPVRTASSSSWLRATQSGMLRLILPLGTHVKRGEIIGFVADLYGENEILVTARYSGIIIGRATMPLVYKGEAVVHIAKFRDASAAAKAVEIFHSGVGPDWENMNMEPQEAPII